MFKQWINTNIKISTSSNTSKLLGQTISKLKPLKAATDCAKFWPPSLGVPSESDPTPDAQRNIIAKFAVSTWQRHFHIRNYCLILFGYWLAVSTPLKNISQLVLLFPIYGTKTCSKPPTRLLYALIIDICRNFRRQWHARHCKTMAVVEHKYHKWKHHKFTTGSAK